MTVLVAYASKHGSTEGIARAIADRLSELGASTDVQTVGEVHDLSPLEAVVLGSAVYAGSWMKEAVEFAHRHAEPLAERPCGCSAAVPRRGGPGRRGAAATAPGAPWVIGPMITGSSSVPWTVASSASVNG